MTSTDSIIRWPIKKVIAGERTDHTDELAIEEPLEIQLSSILNGVRTRKSISVTMRTPGNDEELAIGFLFTEGIIQHASQIKSVQAGLLEENKTLVTLHDEAVPDLPATERNFYTTSSCGVCGKSSIEAIQTVSVYSAVQDQISVQARTFLEMTQELQKQQRIFKSTGGLHASALFELNGRFLMVREDVGRHNALDKVIGTLFLNNKLPLYDKILLLSGRGSFELIQKATMAGIRIVVAIGAPSSLAVQLAEESGITLVGFLKKNSFNIYTGAERIV